MADDGDDTPFNAELAVGRYKLDEGLDDGAEESLGVDLLPEAGVVALPLPPLPFPPPDDDVSAKRKKSKQSKAS